MRSKITRRPPDVAGSRALEQVPDGFGDLPPAVSSTGARRIDDGDAFGFGSGDVQKCLAAAPVDRELFLLEPVGALLAAPSGRTLQPLGGIEVEHDGQVGHHAVYRDALERRP